MHCLRTALGCGGKEKAEQAKAAAEASAKAQKDAEEKAAAALREAEEAKKMAKEHADAASALQKDLDAVYRKLTYLKERGAKAPANKKKNIEAAQAEVDKRAEAVRTSLGKLGTETGATWTAAKTEVEAGLVALKAAMDNFETTVTGKPAK